MAGSVYLFGGFLALASAFLWAVASLIWDQLNKQYISPIVINLGKTVLACIFFGLIFLFIPPDFPDKRNCFFLSLSGILGITIGDTGFFYSIKYLGPRKSVLLTVFIPIATALLAFIFLNESLSLLQWIGILICIYGIVIVIQERAPESSFIIDKKRGIIWASISIAACSLSILISKTALSVTEAFEGSAVRLLAGAIGLIAYCAISRQSPKEIRLLLKPIPLRALFLGSFLGTFLGIWFSIAALKYTLASVATVLNATSPIFILPLTSWFLKEKISKKAICGTMITVTGVALVLIFK